MAAFERIMSGIPQLDQALDNIRLGDNVVFEVTELDEFRPFVNAYVRQAIADGRNLIYIRFASHPALVEEQEGVKIVNVELSYLFEDFTVRIHNIIEKEGYDAFYVFDCLSELQSAWSTDLMMGNFFRLTCPYLFSLDTVAFFPLIRGKHSFSAIAKIRDTTQLFLDVYSERGRYYIRPLKVWERNSETMFMPHLYLPEEGSVVPVTDGIMVSRFYDLMNRSRLNQSDQNMDSWDRFFRISEEMAAQGMDVSANCRRMCEIMMTRDPKMRQLVQSNFRPEDYFAIRSRMIGTGMIGGKACGMLTARKLVENTRPDLFEKLEPHDSFYIGSDVFYSYIVDNNFWDVRIRQRGEEEYFSLADEFSERLRKGVFSEAIREQFGRMLDYYGQSPIIVRSSSILEDGFGNAFAGKYESVFCANVGTLQERMQELEEAIKIVYASTMSRSALDYRYRRGLNKRDEQMAILVMRVSGSRYKDFFMPCAAGVGYSYSPYRFLPSIDPTAGMLRLVMGLGTGAVDRTLGSYPRLISLDKPQLTAATTPSQKHRFSQRRVDVLNLISGKVEHWNDDRVLPHIPRYMANMLLENDIDAERMFLNQGKMKQVRFISCLGLARNEELMGVLREMMAAIQKQYDYPVDIEYTINISSNGDFVINLLQCRPLQVSKDTGIVEIPADIPEEKVLLDCVRSSMGLSRKIDPDYIVRVDPIAYYNMDYKNKYEIRDVIGRINQFFKGKDKTLLLLVPGRICTSSPELGVPTSFSDISEYDVICEVSESRAGYHPELSYGSHIFQDLVEANIMYCAVFGDATTKAFHPEYLERLPECLEEISPADTVYRHIIAAYRTEGTCSLYLDMKAERLVCTLEQTGAG